MNDQNRNWPPNYPMVPNYPGTQGVQPSPQYPNQGYTQPQYPAQPQYPQTPQGPQGQPYPQQPQGQMPQYYMPDASATLALYQQHREQMNNSGSLYDFVKFRGPNGEDKWSTANIPIGYKAVVRFYLLPPWESGKHLFTISRRHFWKSVSKPGGTGIVCPGDGCLVCLARDAALSGNDPIAQQKAKNFGSVRSTYSYQGACLDDYNAHMATGQFRPLVLQAGSTLHAGIGDLIEDRGIGLFDPYQGRPIRLKKKKTGPNAMNIEYSCSDEDPMPLPLEFWPLLENLINLEELSKNPTEEEMQKAVLDMGLSVGNSMSAQVPQQYNIPPQQMDYQQPLPPMVPQQNMPNLVQPNPNYQPQVNQNPPVINPPPVSSGQQSNNYVPQPAQGPTQQPQQQSAPITKTPVSNNQAMTPATLEQLQAAIKGGGA